MNTTEAFHCRQESSLMHALLVSDRNAPLSELAETLENLSIRVVWAERGDRGLSMLPGDAFDLIIADEELPDMTGLQFAKKLISINPMIPCAVVSSLSREDFHEASEGMGLLMQLPVRPKRVHAEDLVKHLRSIQDLTSKVTGS